MTNRFLGALLALVALAAGIVAGIIGFKLATLKNQLAENLGRSLGAQVQVSSLALDAWKGELHAAGIVLINQRADAPWDRGEISQATIRFHWSDLLRPVQPLSLEVASWRLVLRPPPAAAPSGTSGAPASETEAGTRRHGIEVTQLSAHEGEVEIDLSGGRQILLHGVAFDSGDNGGGLWTTQLRAASISAGSLQAGASSVQIRGDHDGLTFSDLHLQCGDGAITGDGQVALGGPHETRATLKALHVPVVMLVAVKWQMKLAGLADGSVNYQGDDRGGQAQGQIALNEGKLNVLPFLGRLSALFGLPDIAATEVDRATADFTWKDGVLHLTNIDVRKNGVIRVAGTVDVDANSQIDGRLKLGLPEGILSKWPQLQSAVFPVSLEDYGWTEVHLTGTPDHLQEDLSARLLAAGVQGGSNLLNQGAQKAIDLFKGIMGQ
jgi:hypothetical protein